MEGTILVFAIFMQYCNFDNKSHEKFICSAFCLQILLKTR